jgi:hypothetical protein
MDHMPRLEAVAAGDLGGAGLPAAQFAALRQQTGAGGAVDRSVDSTAAEQRAVGGIDDGVNVELGDVGDHDLEAAGADLGCHE